MSNAGSLSSDTDSVSSDSGVDSSHSSSSGSSSSDFMDLDEFFSVSNAAAVKEEPKDSPVAVENDQKNSPQPTTNNMNSFDQLKLSDVGNLMAKLISSAAAAAALNPSLISSSVNSPSVSSISACNQEAGAVASETELADEMEKASASAPRRRKYVYNPLPIERKAKRKFIPTKEKDSEYWNRRIKNNIAAKRSRDMRRKKEMEVNERFKELQEENSRLKAEIQILQANAVHLERKLAKIPSSGEE